MAGLDISKQIAEILQEEQDRIERLTQESLETASKEAVDELKQTSPKSSGAYAKGWKVKKEKNVLGVVKFTVHNQDHHSLTHLLNNGHVAANQHGIYSKRVEGDRHIDKVAGHITNKLVKEITGKIKN